MELNSILSNKGLDLRFVDITYKVNNWTDTFKIEKKTILKGVSGAFYQGQLCAIIGCSGCGKSSLLNALSGYKTSGYSGAIFINDKPQELESFQKQSCYIMQEDQLHMQLTVREAIEFASKLKCLTLSLNASKLKMIDLILENLNLLKIQHTATMNLSGGERRKLSIALELVHNPSIMFFDEPTSGLDSLSANQVLATLRELANTGRNIICTIHQASASQLKIFDILYVLTPSGQCIYHGLTSNLLDYLAVQGLRCPLYHNTADYIIEISLGEYGYQAEKLVKYIDNGKSTEWLKNTCQKHLVKEDQLMAVNINDECKDTQFNNHLIQLVILSHRSTVKTLREKFITTRLMVHIIVSAVYGWVYFGVGINASFIHDNLMLLFFSLLFIMYTASSSMIINFPLEIPILSKEHFNQWYSLSSYYLSFTIVDLPIQVLCTFLYCVVLYYFTGQPLEWPRFGLYTLMMLMVGLLSQTIGMLMGTLFNDLRVEPNDQKPRIICEICYLKIVKIKEKKEKAAEPRVIMRSLYSKKPSLGQGSASLNASFDAINYDQIMDKPEFLSNAFSNSKENSEFISSSNQIKKHKKLRKGIVCKKITYEDESNDPNEPRYCLCDRVAFGSMVACDNKKCSHEWFHFECVGITTKPHGKWYCPKCFVKLKRKI